MMLIFNQSAKFVPRRVLLGLRGRLGRQYHENIVDHYENPRNVGKLDKSKSTVGTGLVGAPACGDVMKLQFEVGEDGKIIDAKFKTFGCGSAIGKTNGFLLLSCVSCFEAIFELQFIIYKSAVWITTLITIIHIKTTICI